MVKSKHKKTSTHTHVTFLIKTGDCVVASQEKIQKSIFPDRTEWNVYGSFSYTVLYWKKVIYDTYLVSKVSLHRLWVNKYLWQQNTYYI